MKPLLLAVVCLFLPSITLGDVTYTYYGNNYTTIQDANPPTGSFTTSMSVQGSFTLTTALSPNLTDFALTPNSWLLSDGRNSFNEYDPNYTSNTAFAVSTDAGGAISGWYLNLETNDGALLKRIYSAYNTSFSAIEEDYGYIEASSTQWDKASNLSSHGNWSAVPEPSSPLLLCGLIGGVIARARRRVS